MKSLNSEIRILPAKPVDYENLLTLCRKSDDYFDYINQSLKKWLNFSEDSNERKTEILYFGVEMIGFYSCAFFDNYAFGEILRINKTFQRRGFGILLVNRSVEIAKSHRLNKIRTVVLSTNSQAIKLFAKMGYVEIEKWRALFLKSSDFVKEKKIEKNLADKITAARIEDLLSILNYIKGHLFLSLTKMYARNFSWRPLDKGNLAREISVGRVLIRRNNDKIQSICLYCEIQKKTTEKGFILEINCFDDYCIDFLRFVLQKYLFQPALVRIYAPHQIYLPLSVQQLSFKILEKSW